MNLNWKAPADRQARHTRKALEPSIKPYQKQRYRRTNHARNKDARTHSKLEAKTPTGTPHQKQNTSSQTILEVKTPGGRPYQKQRQRQARHTRSKDKGRHTTPEAKTGTQQEKQKQRQALNTESRDTGRQKSRVTHKEPR